MTMSKTFWIAIAVGLSVAAAPVQAASFTRAASPVALPTLAAPAVSVAVPPALPMASAISAPALGPAAVMPTASIPTAPAPAAQAPAQRRGLAATLSALATWATPARAKADGGSAMSAQVGQDRARWDLAAPNAGDANAVPAGASGGAPSGATPPSSGRRSPGQLAWGGQNLPLRARYNRGKTEYALEAYHPSSGWERYGKVTIYGPDGAKTAAVLAAQDGTRVAASDLVFMRLAYTPDTVAEGTAFHEYLKGAFTQADAFLQGVRQRSAADRMAPHIEYGLIVNDKTNTVVGVYGAAGPNGAIVVGRDPAKAQVIPAE